jgi:tetratricopeptide (TPR) repeat protein
MGASDVRLHFLPETFPSVLLLAALLLIASCTPAPGPPPEEAASSQEFRAHFQRGLELSRDGQLEAALEEFDACLRIDPENAELQYLIGKIVYQRALATKSRLDVAAALLEKAVQLDPEHDGARVLLASLYTRRDPPGTRLPDRASLLYEELLKEKPEMVRFRLDYAQWLVEDEVRLTMAPDPERVSMESSRSLELARGHLEKVLEQVAPDSEEARRAHESMGDLLIRLGEFDAARIEQELLLGRFGIGGEAAARAWQKIALCQWRLGDLESAAASFRKAHEIDPSREYRWDLHLLYEEMGGYPAGFPAGLRFNPRPEVYDRSHPPLLKFTDMARPLGIRKLAGAGPSAWSDVDGDGREDLLVCGCDTFCSLFRNTGEGFTDITEAAGLAHLESGFGAVFADYDNDGDMDFYVTRNGWNGPASNSLMRNDGKGHFSDVTGEAGADATGSSFNAVWADFNRDGWLDLLVSQGVTADGSVNRLLFNDGDGTFTDVTETSGILEQQFLGAIGIAVGDYDDDGWPDIFTHGRYGPNHLYRNRGDGSFRDLTSHAGVTGRGDQQNGYVAFFHDLDADGDLDLFAASLDDWAGVIAGYEAGYRPRSAARMVNTPRYWTNEGNGRFTDRTVEAGLVYPIGVMSGGIADLDNDGYAEIFTGTGNPRFNRLEPNVLLWNVNGERFEDMSRFAGVGSLAKGHGISYNDWDRDGDLDMFIELGGFYRGDFSYSAFYINEKGNGNNWLSITLSQPGLNRNAVGAGVTVKAGSFSPCLEVQAGEGFGSTSAPALHFGLGKRRSVESVTIRWPDGTRQTLDGPPINQRLRLMKGETAFTRE